MRSQVDSFSLPQTAPHFRMAAVKQCSLHARSSSKPLKKRKALWLRTDYIFPFDVLACDIALRIENQDILCIVHIKKSVSVHIDSLSLNVGQVNWIAGKLLRIGDQRCLCIVNADFSVAIHIAAQYSRFRL